MVKREKKVSSSTIKEVLPTMKNRLRKTELRLKMKFEVKSQRKKERMQRKKEREINGTEVRDM